MKLILSRKGFDSKAGGCASPIFRDDSMLSLPIPIGGAAHRMRDATFNRPNFVDRDVVADLSGRYSANSSVHLDPLLRPWKQPVSRHWRPAFGQDGKAQSHLRKEGVKPGDLFLFFGWFRKVEFAGARWRRMPGSEDLHVIFGWLQVGRILRLHNRCRQGTRGWLADHPHVRHSTDMDDHNTLYVAKKCLRLPGLDVAAPGGGTFPSFNETLRLTAPNARSRTDWQLPRWFHPAPSRELKGPHTLSYHREEELWKREGEDDPWTRLKSVDRGQEFVIEIADDQREEALKWLRSLFAGFQSAEATKMAPSR